MVILNFKLSGVGRVETKAQGAQTWRELLLCSQAVEKETPESVIAIRRSRILTPDDLIEDGDEIDIFPALSGG